jgi:hypothetical protein
MSSVAPDLERGVATEELSPRRADWYRVAQQNRTYPKLRESDRRHRQSVVTSPVRGVGRECVSKNQNVRSVAVQATNPRAREEGPTPSS